MVADVVWLCPSPKTSNKCMHPPGQAALNLPKHVQALIFVNDIVPRVINVAFIKHFLSPGYDHFPVFPRNGSSRCNSLRLHCQPAPPGQKLVTGSLAKTTWQKSLGGSRQGSEREPGCPAPKEGLGGSSCWTFFAARSTQCPGM